MRINAAVSLVYDHLYLSILVGTVTNLQMLDELARL